MGGEDDPYLAGLIHRLYVVPAGGQESRVGSFLEPGRLAGGLLKLLQNNTGCLLRARTEVVTAYRHGCSVLGQEPSCVRGRRTSVRARTEVCVRKTIVCV